MIKKLNEPLIALIENTIMDFMQQFKIPGLCISIIQEEEKLYSKAFGARDLEENLPATLDTLFGIGSCTKSFTALAILILQQEGKLNIQDPISKYVPIKLEKGKDPITIHHLLSHSSGLPNLHAADVLILRYLGLDNSYVPLSSWEDFYSFVNGAKGEIKTNPGEKYYYCNSGYTLLQKIIEKVSGQPCKDFIRDKILSPLKMMRSTYNKEKFEKDPDKMVAYGAGEENGKTVVKPFQHPFYEFIHGPGGLLSSVNELFNYLQLYFNKGKFEGTEIIGENLIDQMLKSHVSREKSILAGENGYGYGWGIFEGFYGTKMVAHTGSTGISGAIIAFTPAEKFGVIATINSGLADVLIVLAYMILMILLQKDPMREFPIITIQKKLAMLTGKYQSYKGLEKVNVKKTGGYLTCEILSDVEIIPNRSYPLIPETEIMANFNFFFINEMGLRQPVEFTIDPKNKIDLIIERNVYHRVADI